MSKIRYGIVKTQSSRAAFFCWARGYCQSVCPFFMHKFKSPSLYYKNSLYQPMHARACLKIHSRRLHAPLRGIFGPDSVSVARYASIIGTKSPTKWDAQPTESNFQTRSGVCPNRAKRAGHIRQPRIAGNIKKSLRQQTLASFLVKPCGVVPAVGCMTKIR